MFNKSTRTEEEIKALREKYKNPDALKESVEGLAEKLAEKIILRECDECR